MCNKKQSFLCENPLCEICSKRSILSLDISDKLINEFDKELNGNIDLLRLPYGSHIKLLWKCKNNHSFESTLNSRTNGNTNCRQCFYDSKRKFSKELKTEKIKLNTNSLTTILTGETNEKYVYSLLKTHPLIDDIKIIGFLGIWRYILKIKD